MGSFPFEELFATLAAANIRYVAVGGVAVVLHGHVRYTGDLDLIIDLDPAEARKAMEAMTGAGFMPRVPVPAATFADPVARRSWIDEKNMVVFSMLDKAAPPHIVDFFVDPPIDFEELWKRSVVMQLDTTKVRVASIEDLITLKERAGRAKDLLDIEMLQRIQRSRT